MNGDDNITANEKLLKQIYWVLLPLAIIDTLLGLGHLQTNIIVCIVIVVGLILLYTGKAIQVGYLTVALLLFVGASLSLFTDRDHSYLFFLTPATVLAILASSIVVESVKHIRIAAIMAVLISVTVYWASPLVRPDELVDVFHIEIQFTVIALVWAFMEFHIRQLKAKSQEINNLLKETEAQNRRLHTLHQLGNSFLANMSHELRTPLNSITGFSQVILQSIQVKPDALAQEFLDDIQTIEGSGQYLLGLINTLLDMAKVEAGKMELIREWVPLEDVVADAMSLCAGLITKENKGHLNLTHWVNRRDGGGIAYIDPGKLTQVIVNLLANAIKFTHEGTVSLIATIHPQAIEVVVEDTGVGIPPEDIPGLFNRFHQLANSRKRVGAGSGGTGLGLSLAHDFVVMHGGTIECESALGIGTKFTVTIPLPNWSAEVVQNNNSSSVTVVLVDNDTQILRTYEHSLNKYGYNLVSVSDSTRAVPIIKRLLQERADQTIVILLDMFMPFKGGADVLGDLRQNNIHVPVIVCSVSSQEDHPEMRGMRVYDWLPKPIDNGELAATLRRAIQDTSSTPQQGVTVCIVDDDPRSRQLIRRLLPSEWHVHEAHDGLQAVNLPYGPSLMFLDLMMPGLDGFGVLEKIQNNPKFMHTKTVVITAKDLTLEEKQRLNRLSVAVIQKGSDVANMIKQMIENDFPLVH